jgi:hypothetical protein
MNLGRVAGSPDARADLGWIVEHASGLARAHGRSLFRVRSWALRASSIFAFVGVVVARACISNRWAKVAVLLVSLLPIVVTAPGERAATLGVARGRDATLDDLSRCMDRALPYAALVSARWVLVRNPVAEGDVEKTRAAGPVPYMVPSAGESMVEGSRAAPGQPEQYSLR